MLVSKEFKKSIKEADNVLVRFINNRTEVETFRRAKSKNGWSKPEEENVYVDHDSGSFSNQDFYCPNFLGKEWSVLNMIVKKDDRLSFDIKVREKESYKLTKLTVSIYRKDKIIIYNHVLKSYIEEKI